MSNTINTAAPSTTRVAITSEESMILTSRLGSSYAAPVYHTLPTVAGVSVSLTCLPLLVVKRDNIRDSDGAAVPVGQCTWAISARIMVGHNIDVAPLRAAIIRHQTEGNAPILEVVTGDPDDVLTCYYALNTIGVSPAGGRRNFAVALAMCLADIMSEKDANMIRDGIAGEAPKRAGVDTASIKAQAAAEALASAYAASVAAMVSFGIPLATAQALARGQAVTPVPVVAPPEVKAGGRK